MPNNRYVKLVLKVQHRLGLAGDMFMDVPSNITFGELEQLARNRDTS